MTPSVGRIVHYWTKHEDYGCKSGPYAAIITRVDDASVCLTVFTPLGPMTATAAHEGQLAANGMQRVRWWTWPERV